MVTGRLRWQKIQADIRYSMRFRCQEFVEEDTLFEVACWLCGGKSALPPVEALIKMGCSIALKGEK